MATDGSISVADLESASRATTYKTSGNSIVSGLRYDCVLPAQVKTYIRGGLQRWGTTYSHSFTDTPNLKNNGKQLTSEPLAAQSESGSGLGAYYGLGVGRSFYKQFSACAEYSAYRFDDGFVPSIGFGIRYDLE